VTGIWTSVIWWGPKLLHHLKAEALNLSTEAQFRMAAPASAYKDRQFLAVIGDEVRSLNVYPNLY